MFSSLRRAALLALPVFLVACGGANGEKAPADGAKPGETSVALSTETGAKADMVLGAADAPVTVIEYASVTCPHCATFHENIFPAIKEKYVDTGKVKFVFREFPTPPQGLSYVGSVLARCAADKGGPEAYFAVLKTLFANQRGWIYGDDPKLELTRIAAQAGMDQAAFDACIQRQDLVDLINENVKTAMEKYSVNSTPSFVVDGKLTPIRSAEDFDKIMEEALK